MREEVTKVVHNLDWAMRQPPNRPMIVFKNSHKFPVAFCNSAWSQVTNYDQSSVKEKPLFFFLKGPKNYLRNLGEFHSKLERGDEFQVDLASFDSLRSVYSYTIQIEPLASENGMDVTHQLGVLKNVRPSTHRHLSTIDHIKPGMRKNELHEPSEQELQMFDHDTFIDHVRKANSEAEKIDTTSSNRLSSRTESTNWQQRMDFAQPAGCLAAPITTKAVMAMDKPKAERDKIKKAGIRQGSMHTREQWKTRARRASLSSEMPQSEFGYSMEAPVREENLDDSRASQACSHSKFLEESHFDEMNVGHSFSRVRSSAGPNSVGSGGEQALCELADDVPEPDLSHSWWFQKLDQAVRQGGCSTWYLSPILCHSLLVASRAVVTS
mmetsp:Transcript_2765/g.4505  ORF Transcript_2765/g.4505 Transcript_2765/m.4505 type:complete len:381 (-) Transcript_2765:833-1975(-)